MVLPSNEQNNKFIVSMDKKNLSIQQHVIIDEYKFEVVREFAYLVSLIDDKDNTRTEI